jgi:hypothetical protein
VALPNYSFLTSPEFMKASEVITSMRVSRWVEMVCEWRLLLEGPPLLRQLVMIPR